MPPFAAALLAWFDDHGRHDLPWQQQATLYRVWVSEVMLQQTRVTTVIGYFQRFIARFADVRALAAAPLDEVLHLWSGLGYYARARHLHAAATLVCERFGGEFPRDMDTLRTLPGIGRSTAAAILALADHQRHAILDGNVKRVLARHQGIVGWPGLTAVESLLWHWAEQHTPSQRVAHYTQAIMDLGATVCTARRPQCALCPLRASCIAYATQRVADLPTPRPRKHVPIRTAVFLMLIDATAPEVLLWRRPANGLWGGLWTLPEFADLDAAHAWGAQYGFNSTLWRVWPTVRHTFSHFHLDIMPVYAPANNKALMVMEDGMALWYNLRTPSALGLAAPVQRLLDCLQTTLETHT